MAYKHHYQTGFGPWVGICWSVYLLNINPPFPCHICGPHIKVVMGNDIKEFPTIYLLWHSSRIHCFSVGFENTGARDKCLDLNAVSAITEDKALLKSSIPLRAGFLVYEIRLQTACSEELGWKFTEITFDQAQHTAQDPSALHSNML